MKKLIITLGISGILFTGCVDLLQEPLSFPTPENIEYTENNVTSMTNGLYTLLWGNNYGYNCRTILMGLGADDIVCGSYSKRGTDWDQLYVNMGTMDEDFKIMWTNMYKLIQGSNQLIEGLVATSSLTEEEKQQYLGEAYFMRAFAHFNLVRWFGDVPAFTDSKCAKDFLGNTTITRNSVEDIYKKLIVPDLQLAETLLPNRGRSNAANSTATKWAAKACLAEVYLTMAGWPLKQTEYYADARDKANEIIVDGGYKLVDHYADLWKEETKSNDTEHIFALNHSTSMYSNYGRSYYITEESTSAWSDYVADSCFYENYPNDERKDFNFIAEFVINRRKVSYKNTTMRSPAINKYRDYGGVGSAQSLGITPIYRYADVMLMYAEAQNKAEHGPNPLAYEMVNNVRKRAMGGVANPLTPGLNEEEFDKAVFDERGWEFFCEFKRWFQLVRTEKVWDANQFNPRIKAGIDRYGVTKDNRNVYLMPLPSDEVQSCGFTQNPR